MSFFNNKARAAAAASASSSKTKSDAIVVAPRLQPWVEKYRPANLDEVKSQDHVSSILKKMVQASNLPHLLLYGPPGTGKTSTILALCKELFPPEMMSSRVLELNASDERGITVVREKIKNFAQQAVSMSVPKNSKYPCPPFKIIILDEADSLTQDSQSALRRTMEIYSKTTRICLCCNFVTRIIDPIASRTSKFRFKALDGKDAKDRVCEILEKENVAYEDGVVDLVLKICEGDLRRALQLLQSAARLVGSISPVDTNGQGQKSKKSKPEADDDDDDDDDVEMVDANVSTGNGKKITEEIISEIAGVVPSKILDSLIAAMQKGRSMNFSNLHAAVDDIVFEGYAATEVLSGLYSRLMFDEILDSRKKAKISLILSEADMRLNNGADESLLLHDLVLSVAGILAAK